MGDWERRYKTAIEQTEIAMKVNEQLILDKKKLEQQLKEANEVIDYYLPILEESLSCGAYARNYLTKYKVKE